MDEAAAPPGRWEVWRQDDNGNRYLVSAHPDEAAARARVAELESGVAHKQTYWIAAERVGAAGLGLTQARAQNHK